MTNPESQAELDDSEFLKHWDVVSSGYGHDPEFTAAYHAARAAWFASRRAALPPVAAPVVPDGYAIVPIEPPHAIIKAMAESRAWDDEGEFEMLGDLIGFSGENKNHTVLKAAYRAAIAAAPQPAQASTAQD